jgi:hypothetical protein
MLYRMSQRVKRQRQDREEGAVAEKRMCLLVKVFQWALELPEAAAPDRLSARGRGLRPRRQVLPTFSQVGKNELMTCLGNSQCLLVHWPGKER